MSIIAQPREAIIGRTLAELEPEAEPVDEAIRRAIRERRTIGLQFLQARSGRWFSVRCYPSAIGVIVFANEITRQKQAEERLLLAHQELEHRVEARTHELNSANALLEAVFGRPPGRDRDLRPQRAHRAHQRRLRAPVRPERAETAHAGDGPPGRSAGRRRAPGPHRQAAGGRGAGHRA
ncbi:hypothetical protein D3872_01065 [Massilia cavernae]|uniref:PAS fold-4 domain-containing protein n=1 Tax=Massilia cavernae TaxID=2320864 RepID=A0A418Y883_9BURK|nr:hypothetical protein D3872_01065 [Massilia cavernae]